MNDRQYYESILQNANVQRMLNAIGSAESSNQYDVRYTGDYGGERFDLNAPGSGFLGHPGKKRMADGKLHSDSGRYQIVEDTWKRAAEALGLDNFNDPHQQDLAAAWLLDQRKGKGGVSALQLASQGNFVDASEAARKEWAAIDNKGSQAFVDQYARANKPIVPFGQVTPLEQLTAMERDAVWTPPALQTTQPVPESQAGTVEPFTPPTNPYLQQIQQPIEHAGSESFSTAMREYYSDPTRSVENRTIPGTAESLAMNPFRRFAEGLGLVNPPQPVNDAPSVWSQAAMQGHSFEDWEDRMRQQVGAPALDRASGAPETYYPELYRQGQQLQMPSTGDIPASAALGNVPQPLVPVNQARQMLSGSVDKVKQDAINSVFGKPMANASDWPEEINVAIDDAIKAYTG